MAHPAADAAARASGIGREEEFRRPKPMLAGPPSATWTDVEATMLRNKYETVQVVFRKTLRVGLAKKD